MNSLTPTVSKETLSNLGKGFKRSSATTRKDLNIDQPVLAGVLAQAASGSRDEVELAKRIDLAGKGGGLAREKAYITRNITDVYAAIGLFSVNQTIYLERHQSLLLNHLSFRDWAISLYPQFLHN